MAKIVGTKSAKELTLCREGANQLAHVFMRKSLTTPPTQPDPAAGGSQENDDMPDMTALKAIAAMNDITKSYFVGLEDDAAEAFLKKTAEERDAEAKKAHDDTEAKKKAAEEAEAAKTAKDDSVQETLKALKAQNEELQKRLDSQSTERELEKQASAPEYAFYPGGKEAVLTVLKSVSALTEEQRKPILDSLKSQSEMAKKLGTGDERGGRTEEEVERAAPSYHKVEVEARKRMEAKGISKVDAIAELQADAEWAPLVSKAATEEERLRAA